MWLEVRFARVGANKIHTIKEVRSITSFGLRETKDLVEGSRDSLILRTLDRAEAERVKQRIDDTGSLVDIIEVEEGIAFERGHLARGDQPLVRLRRENARVMRATRRAGIWEIDDQRDHPSSPEAASEVARQFAAWRAEGRTITGDEITPLLEVSVEDPEAVARLAASPDDANAFLVYGDWLSERGDPRGQLVAIQHALETRSTPELAHEAAALLERHADHLLGPLRRNLASGLVELEWRHGFIDAARVGADTLYPPREPPDGSAGAVSHLLRLPAARLLRKLDVRAGGSAVARVLAAHGATTLRDVGLADHSSYVDLVELAPSLPHLESLRLQVDHGDPAPLAALPNLRRLTIKRLQLDIQSPFPALEDLVITTTMSTIGGLAAAFPRLRSLTANGAESGLIKQLRHALPGVQISNRLISQP
jgi:uncharacterized protein (TIGR02996 family)